MNLFLTVSLCAATLCLPRPASAQSLPQGRIEQSLLREGRRLAALTQASTQRTVTAADRLWSAVRRVPGGAGVEVSTGNQAQAPRIFVTADDTSITVLNLMEDRLPPSARRVLRDLARVQPGILLSPDQVYKDNGVRLDRAGIRIGSRLLASRAELIEHISRDDLRKLSAERPGGSFWGRGLLVGMAAGALAAYVIGSRCGQGAAPSDCSLAGVTYMPIGAGLGAAAGGIVGASFTGSSATVVYAAP
jgi:hypothetical protein